MTIIILYASLMLVIALPGLRRMRGLEGFVTAGRRSGTILIAASLVATIAGASSTLGMAQLARAYGGAAFWWLGLGAIGLVLMAWLTARPLWELKALSIADVVTRLAGRGAGRLAGSIIVIAWTGIIAAQLVAIGSVLSAFSALDPTLVILLAGLSIILYTVVGGQRGVIKTDLLQLLVLTGGMVVVFLLLAGQGRKDEGLILQPLLNNAFDVKQLLFMALPLLGAYAAGPDMFSRINTARSVSAARRGLVLAGLAIVAFGALVTSLALLALDLPASDAERNPLLGAVLQVLPEGIALLFVLALVSAMVSSADTCLLTAGSILGHDLVGSTDLARVRILVALTGITATLLALFFRDIIGLMISSYAVYTAGIASPLVVALVARKKGRLPRQRWFLLGMLGGSVCGLSAVIWAQPFLTVAGTVFGAGVTLFSLNTVEGGKTPTGCNDLLPGDQLERRRDG